VNARSAFCKASLALAVTMLARDAAASPTSRLVYVRGAGAESCPDEPEMRRAVATRLGYDPFRPLASTTLTAEVRRENGVFRGRVKLVDDAGVERGARDLESRAADCRDLTTAMALSMSIAIDPLSLMRPTPAAPPEVVDPPLSPVPVPVPVPVPDLAAPPGTDDGREAPPQPPPGDPLRLSFALATHAAFGIAPAPSVGFRLSAEITTKRLSLGLEGRLDLPASTETAEGGRSRTSLSGATLVPCVRVPLAWACGVMLVSRVDAEAVDVTSPRSEGFLFLGAGGRLVTAIPLAQDLSLRIGGDVLAHPLPFELTVNGRRIYRSSTVSALAGVGVAWIF
jgi:hypothetical protein